MSEDSQPQDVVELNAQIKALREVVAAILNVYEPNDAVGFMHVCRKLSFHGSIVAGEPVPGSPYARIAKAIQHALDIGAL